jgi:hypothetical protein
VEQLGSSAVCDSIFIYICESQDLTLLTMLPDGVAIVGQTFAVVFERYRLWVLKKSLNRTAFHLPACRRRFSCLRSTKWWPAEPVLSAD